MNKYWIRLLSITLVLSILLGNAGCLCSLIFDEVLKSPVPTSQPVPGVSGRVVNTPPAGVDPPRLSTPPANLSRAPLTGSVTTGQPVKLATASVPVQGGETTVKSAGHPLDGLTLTVPPNAYSKPLEFSISASPVTANTFKNINWVTPLISIQNGGEYANGLMQVRIPFKTPPGKFAMGFIYDRQTGRLEGLPTVESTADSITIATRHFTDFGLSMIDDLVLQADIYSGFWPGFDDWEFTNYGSIIAPGGHCAGQSMTAMWYYITQPDGPGVTLYKRYDNNGKQPATPKVWEDNSFGYRFASMAHDAINWDDILVKFWSYMRGKDDGITWRLCAYSMLVNNEPQQIGMVSTAKNSGHAMICYRVNNGSLYVADPNYPGNSERLIEFANGKYKPYESGLNAREIAAGNSVSYDQIGYRAKTQMLGFDKIEAFWKEFKAGTVGNTRFPKYQFTYFDDNGKEQPLTDGLKLSNPQLKFNLKVDNYDGAITFFRDNVFESLSTYALTLVPGENNLGFAVWADSKDGSKNPYRYVDYVRFKVSLAATLSVTPPNLQGEPGKEYTFTAKPNAAPPAGATFIWTVNGQAAQSGASATYVLKKADPGTYEIRVKMVDAKGAELASGGSTATLARPQTTAAAGALAKLQQYKKFSAYISPMNAMWEVTDNKGTATKDAFGYGARGGSSFRVPAYGNKAGDEEFDITWNGPAFTGRVNYTNLVGDTYVANLNGSVSADGVTITTVTFTATYSNRAGTLVDKATLVMVNLPVWQKSDTRFEYSPVGLTQDAACKNHISRAERSIVEMRPGPVTVSATLKSLVWEGQVGGSIETHFFNR
jgi:hypothetical protein